ncbi:MAG: hypothetical protein M3M99_07915, partial [Actinomycetota bacterium]|nr:hypothetical protein [Actinomycetota bacterium]
QGVRLAPRAEHRELEEIGKRFEGRGPALVTEGSVYGPRHFLRELDAEHDKDLRRSQVTLADGSLPDDLAFVDTDAIATESLAPYRLLVFRRSPVASRPPGEFRLAGAGKFYEVWERSVALPGRSLAEHLPLGRPPSNSAVPDCAELKALADRAGAGATLMAAVPGDYVLVDLAAASRPESWGSSQAGTFTPRSSGTLQVDAEVLTPGEYRLWVGGNVLGELTVAVGGQQAASERQAINSNLYQPFGPFTLTAGTQTITMDYEGRSLHPGSGEEATPLGPIVLERVQADDRGTVAVPASDYQRLCDQPWDWIEAYS